MTFDPCRCADCTLAGKRPYQAWYVVFEFKGRRMEPMMVWHALTEGLARDKAMSLLRPEERLMLRNVWVSLASVH